MDENGFNNRRVSHYFNFMFEMDTSWHSHKSAMIQLQALLKVSDTQFKEIKVRVMSFG